MVYITVYINRYNNGERNFKKEYTVFDSNEIDTLFSPNECKSETEGTVTIRKMLLKGIRKQQPDFDSPAYADITSMCFDTEKLDEEFNNLVRELMSNAITVSGDDDSYDYFPDLVYAFEQLCNHFGKQRLFMDTAELLNKILGYDKDDELYIA